MEFFVALWIHSSLEDGQEYVLQNLGKMRYQFL